MNDCFVLFYVQYLVMLCECVDQVFVCGGFDYLLIVVGQFGIKFFDDNYYLYVVNLLFKYWLLLICVLGSWIVYMLGVKLKLVFLQLCDYWYVVFEVFIGYWVEQFEIVIVCIVEEVIVQLFKCNVVVIVEVCLLIEGVEVNNFKVVFDYLYYYCVYKMLYELELMCEVSCIGICVYCVVEWVFCVGESEFGIYQVYFVVVGQIDVELFYFSIVVFNEYGVVLYYMDFICILFQLLCLLLIDVGVSISGYVSDIICIYVVDGYGEFQVLIDVMDVVQCWQVVSVKVGVDYVQLYVQVYYQLVEVLYVYGLICMSVESVVESGVMCVFFLYGLGYLIGLQVYDVVGFVKNDCGEMIVWFDGYLFLCMMCQFELGMVVIIELGLYFIDMLLDEVCQMFVGKDVDWVRVDVFKFYGGICIEDDVVCIEGVLENFICDVFIQFS